MEWGWGVIVLGRNYNDGLLKNLIFFMEKGILVGGCVNRSMGVLLMLVGFFVGFCCCCCFCCCYVVVVVVVVVVIVVIVVVVIVVVVIVIVMWLL